MPCKDNAKCENSDKMALINVYMISRKRLFLEVLLFVDGYDQKCNNNRKYR
jgi:hypothetical protein